MRGIARVAAPAVWLLRTVQQRAVAVGAVAALVAYTGVRKTFVEDLDLSTASPAARTAAIRLGQAGYPALGVAYAIIGLARSLL